MGALIATVFTVVVVAISSIFITNPELSFDLRSRAGLIAPVATQKFNCEEKGWTWKNNKCTNPKTPTPTPYCSIRNKTDCEYGCTPSVVGGKCKPITPPTPPPAEKDRFGYKPTAEDINNGPSYYKGSPDCPYISGTYCSNGKRYVIDVPATKKAYYDLLNANKENLVKTTDKELLEIAEKDLHITCRETDYDCQKTAIEQAQQKLLDDFVVIDSKDQEAITQSRAQTQQVSDFFDNNLLDLDLQKKYGVTNREDLIRQLISDDPSKTGLTKEEAESYITRYNVTKDYFDFLTNNDEDLAERTCLELSGSEKVNCKKRFVREDYLKKISGIDADTISSYKNNYTENKTKYDQLIAKQENLDKNIGLYLSNYSDSELVDILYCGQYKNNVNSYVYCRNGFPSFKKIDLLKDLDPTSADYKKIVYTSKVIDDYRNTNLSPDTLAQHYCKGIKNIQERLACRDSFTRDTYLSWIKDDDSTFIDSIKQEYKETLINLIPQAIDPRSTLPDWLKKEVVAVNTDMEHAFWYYRSTRAHEQRTGADGKLTTDQMARDFNSLLEKDPTILQQYLSSYNKNPARYNLYGEKGQRTFKSDQEENAPFLIIYKDISLNQKIIGLYEDGKVLSYPNVSEEYKKQTRDLLCSEKTGITNIDLACAKYGNKEHKEDATVVIDNYLNVNGPDYLQQLVDSKKDLAQKLSTSQSNVVSLDNTAVGEENIDKANKAADKKIIEQNVWTSIAISQSPSLAFDLDLSENSPSIIDQLKKPSDNPFITPGTVEYDQLKEKYATIYLDRHMVTETYARGTGIAGMLAMSAVGTIAGASACTTFAPGIGTVACGFVGGVAGGFLGAVTNFIPILGEATIDEINAEKQAISKVVGNDTAATLIQSLYSNTGAWGEEGVGRSVTQKDNQFALLDAIHDTNIAQNTTLYSLTNDVNLQSQIAIQPQVLSKWEEGQKIDQQWAYANVGISTITGGFSGGAGAGLAKAIIGKTGATITSSIGKQLLVDLAMFSSGEVINWIQTDIQFDSTQGNYDLLKTPIQTGYAICKQNKGDGQCQEELNAVLAENSAALAQIHTQSFITDSLLQVGQSVASYSVAAYNLNKAQANSRTIVDTTSTANSTKIDPKSLATPGTKFVDFNGNVQTVPESGYQYTFALKNGKWESIGNPSTTNLSNYDNVVIIPKNYSQKNGAPKDWNALTNAFNDPNALQNTLSLVDGVRIKPNSLVSSDALIPLIKPNLSDTDIYSKADIMGIPTEGVDINIVRSQVAQTESFFAGALGMTEADFSNIPPNKISTYIQAANRLLDNNLKVISITSDKKGLKIVYDGIDKRNPGTTPSQFTVRDVIVEGKSLPDVALLAQAESLGLGDKIQGKTIADIKKLIIDTQNEPIIQKNLANRAVYEATEINRLMDRVSKGVNGDGVSLKGEDGQIIEKYKFDENGNLVAKTLAELQLEVQNSIKKGKGIGQPESIAQVTPKPTVPDNKNIPTPTIEDINDITPPEPGPTPPPNFFSKLASGVSNAWNKLINIPSQVPGTALNTEQQVAKILGLDSILSTDPTVQEKNQRAIDRLNDPNYFVTNLIKDADGSVWAVYAASIPNSKNVITRITSTNSLDAQVISKAKNLGINIKEKRGKQIIADIYAAQNKIQKPKITEQQVAKILGLENINLSDIENKKSLDLLNNPDILIESLDVKSYGDVSLNYRDTVTGEIIYGRINTLESKLADVARNLDIPIKNKTGREILFEINSAEKNIIRKFNAAINPQKQKNKEILAQKAKILEIEDSIYSDRKYTPIDTMVATKEKMLADYFGLPLKDVQSMDLKNLEQLYWGQKQIVPNDRILEFSNDGWITVIEPDNDFNIHRIKNDYILETLKQAREQVIPTNNKTLSEILIEINKNKSNNGTKTLRDVIAKFTKYKTLSEIIGDINSNKIKSRQINLSENVRNNISNILNVKNSDLDNVLNKFIDLGILDDTGIYEISQITPEQITSFKKRYDNAIVNTEILDNEFSDLYNKANIPAENRIKLNQDNPTLFELEARIERANTAIRILKLFPYIDPKTNTIRPEIVPSLKSLIYESIPENINHNNVVSTLNTLGGLNIYYRNGNYFGSSKGVLKYLGDLTNLFNDRSYLAQIDPSIRKEYSIISNPDGSISLLTDKIQILPAKPKWNIKIIANDLLLNRKIAQVIDALNKKGLNLETVTMNQLSETIYDMNKSLYHMPNSDPWYYDAAISKKIAFTSTIEEKPLGAFLIDIPGCVGNVCYQNALLIHTIAAIKGVETKTLTWVPKNSKTNGSAGDGHALLIYKENGIEWVTDPTWSLTMSFEQYESYIPKKIKSDVPIYMDYQRESFVKPNINN